METDKVGGGLRNLIPLCLLIFHSGSHDTAKIKKQTNQTKTKTVKLKHKIIKLFLQLSRRKPKDVTSWQ